MFRTTAWLLESRGARSESLILNQICGKKLKEAMAESKLQEFWRNIVRITDGSRCEIIRSIRVVLFIWLPAEMKNSIRKQLARLLSIVRPLLPMKKEALPPAKSGQIVFCFAHGTPA